MTLENSDEKYLDNIDRKQLTKLKHIFVELNRARYKRTLEVLSERQQQFLELLPLLFHVNHPMLPGYISHHTPASIAGYTPTKEEIRLAKIVARSFNFQRDISDRENAIDALFFMGSLGTIAHTDNSDLDVWVCYSSNINESELSQLHEKCLVLSRWAADNTRLEAHFFLMNAAQFRQGQQSILSGDASGTAQHYLLLDEFYRTAVWLAGKLPLWWFVPLAWENDYANYTKNLLEKRFLKAADYIDFGGIPQIPTNEFVGAGIWQLYKGIESPYKSALKLLLLEAYNHSDFNEPLSLSFKRLAHQRSETQQALNVDDLDAYVLVYRRLENYLLAQNQPARLELVRRCLYFKTGKKLSHKVVGTTALWQRQLLSQMIAIWGWKKEYIALLDNRAQWKSPDVLIERNLLVNELNQAYRLLADLNKDTENEAAISNQELLILGRKLHAAFERKAGKIDWINPNISTNIYETELCFVQGKEESSSLWLAFRGNQQLILQRKQLAEPIKRSRHFIELLIWCYANGILATTTKVDLLTSKFSLRNTQRQQLIQAVQQWLPFPTAKVDHDSFIKNAFPTQILLLLNIGIEPQAALQKKGLQMLSSQRDAFGYSGFKENLVLRADIVQCNSWGEIICRHFDKDALVNCLLHYLRSIPPGKHLALPELTIRCFTAGQGATIEQRVSELWQSIISCFYSGMRTRNARYLFEMADEYLILQFIQQQAHIFRFNSYEKLLEKLKQPQPSFCPLVVDNYALRDNPLRLFFEIAKTANIYIFYHIEALQIQITLVDYNNTYFTKSYATTDIHRLLTTLSFFIRTTLEQQALDSDQIHELENKVDRLQPIKIYELLIDTRQKAGHLEFRNFNLDAHASTYCSITAVAEPGENETLIFTLFCDNKEFSSLEFGDDLFIQTASYLINRKLINEKRSLYVTDLDLSLCREVLAPQTGLQLVHYLTIKDDIETQLVFAISRLTAF